MASIRLTKYPMNKGFWSLQPKTLILIDKSELNFEIKLGYGLVMANWILIYGDKKMETKYFKSINYTLTSKNKSIMLLRTVNKYL